ncbi:MAG: PHP domain-containing protein [Pseudomonadales bacterium]
MKIDLHTHSTASDGSLAPAELLQLAYAKGVSVLALTDHDTLAGYFVARRWLDSSSGKDTPLTLVPGVEISTQWGRQGIHVLGLNVDPQHARLADLLNDQQRCRAIRAAKMASKLEKLGMPGVQLHLDEHVDDATQIGRPHIANGLVALGYVENVEQAFKKYLGNGKPADVRLDWAALPDVVEAISSANGIAVLAHPAKYKMTATKLRALLADFARAGGRGIELVSGAQTSDTTKVLTRLAEQFDLLLSCGSDFHSPESRWQSLGEFPSLPKSSKVVWQEWNLSI